MSSKSNAAVSNESSGPNSAMRPQTFFPRDLASTIMAAESAINRIKALNLPADPPSYELWYSYEQGHNPVLNKAINDVFAKKGVLSIEDLDEIYDCHLSPTRLGDAIDVAGHRLDNEIEEITSILKATIGSAGNQRRHFADVREKLKAPIDHTTLRSILEGLVFATHKAEQENGALEARLQASKQEIETLRSNLTTIRYESLTDPLTQITNRKGFDDALTMGIDKARLQAQPFCLLMVDIDHFKKFNDSFGHVVGDHVLRLVGLVLKQSVKGRDTAARYGGEEFAMILPETRLSDAGTVAENIRRTIMSKELMVRSTGQQLGRVTVSIGVALLRPDDTAVSLIERADRCLYAAKRNGRNQVASENKRS